jgi:hypothetical protein
MIVATYYEPIEGYADGNHAELIRLWIESWRAQGMVPWVVSVAKASTHPSFGSLTARASTFPTVNPRNYEEACYLRWCAFSVLATQQSEKIVAMDYDVFPTDRWEGWPEQSFCAEFGHIPSCVSGRASDFDRIVEMLIRHEPDDAVKHVSDMLIMRAKPEIFDSHYPWTLCYGEPGWRRKPLVHFGSWYMPDTPSRAEVVRSLLDSNGLVKTT